MPWRRRGGSSENGGDFLASPHSSSTIQQRGGGNNEGDIESTLTSSSSDYSTIGGPHAKPEGWGKRHTLVFLGFFGFLASYTMRVNLSFAIVAMVTSNSSSSTSNTTINVCPLLDPNEIGSLSPAFHDSNEDGEFDWSGEDQGIILGAFFWGYVLTQVPGGMIAERIGGKWPFGIGMLITAVFSLLTPLAARWGKGVLITVRIIQGLGEGVTNPSAHALLARWLPPLERSRYGGLVYSGSQVGTVIAMPLCGFLIGSGFGWESVFYVMGIIGVVWFIFWSAFVYDTPCSHPHIEARELSYIQHSIGAQTSKYKVPTPWKKMLSSMPVFAILVAQTGHGWGLYTLLTELPTYLKTVMHFDIKSNGWISALPYLTMWLVSLYCGWFCDYLRERDLASTTTVRKLFNTVAHFIPGCLLIGAAYSGCDRVLAVGLLTAAVGFSGAAYASFQVNHIDLAPNHAAVMMGVTNGFANLMGIASPYVAGVIISGGGTLLAWRLIFLIAAGIYIFDNIFYLLFASGDEQEWNRGDDGIRTPQRSKSSTSDREPLLQPSYRDAD